MLVRGHGDALINHARVVTAASVVMALCTASGGQCQYELTIIEPESCGIPFGPPPGKGLKVTESGHVAGYFSQCPPNESYEDSFIWTPTGGINIIENPWPIISAKMFDINESEQIVGVLSDVQDSFGFLGFVWENGAFTPLSGFPSNGTNSEANAINEAGEVVGWWGNTIVGGPSVGAFLWEDGVFVNLYPVLGYPNNEAKDINDLGHITGWRGKGSASGIGFLMIDEGIVNIPWMPNSSNSIGIALNNLDQVVGRSRIGVGAGTNNAWRSFLWDDDQMTDLGVLPGYSQTFAQDINDHGQIVGYCSVEGTHSRAFVWDGGQIFDLNDFAPPDVEIRFALGINDAGQITGFAAVPGNGSVPFLLTPTAMKGDLNADCSVGPGDLAILLGNWGPCKQPCAPDMNGDGTVNMYDLTELLATWGPPGIR